MAQTESIREFLVKLGFVTDQPALTKFRDGLEKATKAVFALSSAITAMATTAAIGIERFSANLEGLYFSAQRIGTSVQNLTAFERTMQNFGLTAEEAGGALEGFAQLLNEHPELQGQLQALLSRVGAKVSKDPLENLLNLTKYLTQLRGEGAYGFRLAQTYAEQFGISYKALFALTNPATRAALEAENARRQKEIGNAANIASERAHKLMEDFRNLQTTLQHFGFEVYDAIANKFGLSLKSVNAWLQAHGHELAQKITAAIKAIIDWVRQAIETFKKWYATFEQLDQKTHGWLGKLAAIVLVLHALGATDLISGVVRLGAALAGAMVSIGPVALAVAGIAAAVAGLIKGVDYLNAKFPNNRLSTLGADLNRALGGPSLGLDLGGTGGDINSRLSLDAKHDDNRTPFAQRMDERLKRFGEWVGLGSNRAADAIAGAFSNFHPLDWFTRSGGFNPQLQAMQQLPGGNLSAPQVTQNITINVQGSVDRAVIDRVGRTVQSATQRALGPNVTRSALASVPN